jgi:uroporphyrinogen III methyltransferase / synthase
MKVLITRPRSQSAAFGAALQQAGFEPVYFPVIEIRWVEDLSELDAALAEIKKYAWVVFTSVNGVEVVFNHMVGAGLVSADAQTGHSQGLPLPYIAAVGKKTAEALRVRGIEPFFVPEEFAGEAILPGLGDLGGKWVLLPRAEIARTELPEAIRAAGGVAHEIIVYHTLPAEADADGLAALKAGIDWITFTSPSTVQNFVQIARQNGLDSLNLPGKPKIACIGPVTERAAREAGFEAAAVAQEYTTEGIITMIGTQGNK